MEIGVPKEVKDRELRVGLTPASVAELSQRGHQVVVQHNAGIGIGANDDAYVAAGARIASNAEEVFASTEMIVKVKEPQAGERALLNEKHLLFTYLHLAPDPAQAQDLIDSGCTAIAYETVTDAADRLPLLAPMSKVAGRMAVQAAAHCLEAPNGGSGLLIGGVPGVQPAEVVIIGGGVVGENSAEIAVGMGANVTVLDRSIDVLDHLGARFGTAIRTEYSTADALERLVLNADVVIGAVLVRGAKAPKLVSSEMVAAMQPGSVLVDVAIDQGGAFETSKPTSHSEPTYVIDDVVHYCVANMPGAVPKTSTYALNNSTLPFVLALADNGARDAMAQDPHLLNGLNVIAGQVTEPAVAAAIGADWIDPATAI